MIYVNDLLETDKGSVFDSRVARAEKLPSVIVKIVRDMHDRFRASHNLPNCQDRAIRRLVKFPFIHVYAFF
jgi:hypothetical protein